MALRLTHFVEIDPSPRKEWLVKGLLGAGELSCIFGAPGSGKSVLVGDLAAHIAAGLDWFGRPVARGAVLYVAAERGALVKRRFAAWRKAHNCDGLPLAVVEGTIDLRTNKTTVTELNAATGEISNTYRQPVKLIIIDTASRAIAGGDENSPKDMGSLVGNLAAIQQATGAHVLVVHHVPQDGSQRLRGHGALLGAIDTSIGVEKHDSSRTATVDKANDSEEGERIGFELESVQIADDGTTAPVVVSSDAPFTKAKPKRRLPDKDKAALDVLTDLCVDGKPLAASDLPTSIRATDVESWRKELYRRGILDESHSSPREDFRRVKMKLIGRRLVAERDGMVWAA